MRRRAGFAYVASTVSHWAGHPVAAYAAIAVVAVWLATGPLFHYSDTWQLAINTGTTIVTFLMVFLIQNTQNRDSLALQIKLDELIRAVEGAHNAMLDLESLTEEELTAMRQRYLDLAAEARRLLREGGRDTGSPDIADR
jgi:low affinity Fe/Cu permease